MSNKRLLYIAGPTAVGKTALSVSLAQHFKTEILSCDARQCYKEMYIGTAVPTHEEKKNIPHHFIQNKSIHQSFGADDFEKEGLLLLEKLFQKYERIIMVGGSGLYAKALMEGLDKFPEISSTAIDTVSELFKKSGLQGLQKTLAEKDLDYFQTVDLNNHRRLIRALEVCETAQRPYSSFLRQSAKTRTFTIQTLLLTMPREKLYDRINQRVLDMVSLGLENEAQSLYAHQNLPALQTLGYQEWFRHFNGTCTREEAIVEIQKNTRRYAKRQLTWFQKMEKTTLEMGIFQQTLQRAIPLIR